MSVTAIVPAAGAGERFHSDIKKQFYQLGGMPLLARTISNLSMSDEIDNIIVVTHPEQIDHCEKIIAEHDLSKVSAAIEGGATRQESVSNGFRQVAHDVELVMVHDGVRPFVTADMVDAVAKAAREHGAAIAAVKVTDTIKKVIDDVVTETVDRGGLVRSHTPQCFQYDILRDAIKKAEQDSFAGTDEASLVERIGLDVHIVEGSPSNIKITIMSDLTLARALLDFQKK